MNRSQSSRTRRSAVRRRRERGTGLLDCLVAVVVISLSSMGFVAASLSSRSLEVEARTVQAAVELTRAVMEELHATPVDELVARYNADPDDDPDGSGTSRGSSFELDTRSILCDLLECVDDVLTGREAEVVRAIPPSMECTITLPTIVDGKSGLEVLREDTVAPELGLPADLNGDGTIDGDDRTGDYRILPLAVQLAWPTADGGTRTVAISAVFGGRGRS